jgi:AGZA family xanthine/uracil permease-like MFS transporter
MCYIIAVNASIISQTGGTCVCNGGEADPICKDNLEYTVCVQGNYALYPRLSHDKRSYPSPGIQRDLVTATAAIAALSSFAFGFLTNMPVCLA